MYSITTLDNKKIFFDDVKELDLDKAKDFVTGETTTYFINEIEVDEHTYTKIENAQ